MQLHYVHESISISQNTLPICLRGIREVVAYGGDRFAGYGSRGRWRFVSMPDGICDSQLDLVVYDRYDRFLQTSPTLVRRCEAIQRVSPNNDQSTESSKHSS